MLDEGYLVVIRHSSFDRRHASIEHGDDFAEVFGLGAFEDDCDLGEEFAAAVRGGGVGEGAFFGQFAADADAAEVLGEVGGRPVSKLCRVAADDVGGGRVGTVIEPGCFFNGVDEQLVGVDAEAGGQFVERTGVRLGRAAEETADRAFVEAGGVDHLEQGEPLAHHQAADILAVEGAADGAGRGGDCGSLSHRPSAGKLGKLAGGWVCIRVYTVCGGAST